MGEEWVVGQMAGHLKYTEPLKRVWLDLRLLGQELLEQGEAQQGERALTLADDVRRTGFAIVADWHIAGRTKRDGKCNDFGQEPDRTDQGGGSA